MERTATEQYQIPAGTEVHSADGEKLGKVVATRQGYLVVEKGFFFPTDYFIPTSAISTYDADKVYLNISKDEALNQGWELEPGAGVVSASDATLERDRLSGASTPSVGAADEDDRLVVPVHEEELTATKRPVERGEVRIEKDVAAEDRTLDVPVTEERVRVTRRAVDRDAETGELAFEEGSIDVPIRGERVDVEKRTRVAEEVEVAKEQVQRTERVGGTVRKERVHVDETGATDVTGGGASGEPTSTR
jgi:uncharacterized protein (TIGR02271 family)